MQNAGLKRELTFRHVLFYGLAFMAPATAYSVYGISVTISQGMVPTAYLLATILMLFTAYSYGQMTKEFPIAGSAYTFVQQTMHSNLGFLVGWTILRDYLFLPMLSCTIFSTFVTAFFPQIPYFAAAIFFILVISTVNILGIRLSANVNTLGIVTQVLLIAFFVYFCAKALAGGEGTGVIFSGWPFYDPDVSWMALYAVVPILCLTFLGFDSISTLAEETKEPRKVLPQAIIWACLVTGMLGLIITYFAQLVYPDFNSFADPDSAAMDIISLVGGTFLSTFFLVTTIIGTLASAIASMGSGSRVLYIMGREKALPNRFFGFLNRKFGTPALNVILIGLLALGSLVGSLTTITSLVNFGALLSFVFVNLTVIAHYYVRKNRRSPKDTFRYLVLPLVGAVITFLFWTQLDQNAFLLGSAWLVIGLIYLVYKTKGFRVPAPKFHFDESRSM